MQITNLEELQYVTNYTLREAMANERSRRWPKVIQSYRRLLRMLRPSHFPKSYDKPPWLSILYYELHFHLGIALQHVKEDKKAVVQYTKAIEAVSIPKGGCLADCNSNSCLMTPLFARRAFACARAGDIRTSIKDAEKAVVLDSRNPDVYCIRSLARSSRKEDSEAMKDAEHAIKLNKNHACALILRGTLSAVLSPDFTDWENFGKKETMCADHVKACNINPDCHNYLLVHNYNHPDITTFYDRFLYSLNIPHTISEVNLTTPGQNCQLSEAARKACTVDLLTMIGKKPPKYMVPADIAQFRSPSLNLHPTQVMMPSHRAFRCGTSTRERDANVHRRRQEYGDAVREHLAKPRSMSDFIAWLENGPKPNFNRRPASAIPVQPKTNYDVKSRPFSAMSRVNTKGTVLSDVKNDSICQLDASKPLSTSKPTSQLYTPSSKFTITSGVTPKKNNFIKAFQPLNLEDAPRMYYKPWKGDRLPVADLSMDKSKSGKPKAPFK